MTMQPRDRSQPRPKKESVDAREIKRKKRDVKLLKEAVKIEKGKTKVSDDHSS